MFRKTITQNFAKRYLSIHEYRSAQLLNQYGINTPKGKIAFSPKEASDIAMDIPSRQVVLKAQALTGGRGKGHFENGFQGGVQIINNDYNDVSKISEKMLGQKLITKQSGPKGKFVSGVYIVEKIDAIKEAYLSILMDRSKQMPLIIASKDGGVNIEEIAETNPNSIKKFYVKQSDKQLDLKTARKAANALGFSKEIEEETAQMIIKLYKIFNERDATQIEINPLSEVIREDSKKHEPVCLDAKFGFDDNASFRQEEIFSWRDLTQEDPNEVEAKKYELNFVKLNGNIGCLVNGAGLAMATMDVIKLNGGDPANFLDCGGGATPETIKKGFELILSNDKVDAIFVNIFGGIVRCDHVAMGLISAAKELNIKIPIVARLQGTNLDKGRELIDKSGVKIYSFDELDPAAKKAVELSQSH